MHDVSQHGVYVADVVQVLPGDVQLLLIVQFQRELDDIFSNTWVRLWLYATNGVVLDVRVLDDLRAQLATRDIALPSHVTEVVCHLLRAEQLVQDL